MVISEIALHAISRDPSSFPEECIYVSLDGGKGESSDSSEDDEMEGGEVNGNAGGVAAAAAEEERELFFVPDEKVRLEAMFDAIREGQALHPDPEDADSEEGEYEGIEHEEDMDDVEGEGDEARAGVGGVNLGAGDLMADQHGNEGQFEDDEEGEGEGEDAQGSQHFGGGDG